MAGQQGSLARLLWRFAALLVGVCSATLLAGTLLLQSTLRNAQQETFDARFALVAQRAAAAAEGALALGVPMVSGTPLAALLEREAALEPVLRSFSIVSPQGEVILAAPTGDGAGAAHASGLWRAPVRNDLGEPVAWVELRYGAAALHRAQQQLERALWRAVAPVLGLVAVGLLVCCGWLVRQGRRGQAAGDGRGRLVLVALGLLAAGLLWLGVQATAAAQEYLTPDQRAKAQAVARSSAALVARAVEAGVPLQSLVGVAEHTEAVRARSPEIAALAVLAPDGARVAGTAVSPGPWTVSAAVRPAGRQAAVAQVLVQLDPQVLARALRATLLDMAFLGAICLLLALEWVALGLGTRGARALSAFQARRVRLGASGARAAWRASPAAAVRPALFLFMLAEEFTRPFLPTWARGLAPADMGLSVEALASLPLAIFLALVALLQWPLASWSERFGRRRGLVLGALLGSAGLAWAAWLPQFGALLGGRALGAVGFAMVFVSAQGAVIDGSSPQDRARSLAQFVRAILVAGLCGPPLGGMLAERWSADVALAAAAAVAGLAAAVAWLQVPAGRPVPVGVVPGRAPAAPLASSALLRAPGMGALLLGCALPAKLLLAGLCFYLLPLHLQDLGHGSAVTGRLQTLYPLTMVLLVPLAARLADQRGRREAFVFVGGVLAGASALLAWPAAGAPVALGLVLLGLGLGQALSITPQSALVADRARSLPARQGARLLGMFRLVERGGSALGPVAGAWLLPLLGFGAAVALLGAVALGGSLAYGWQLWRRRGAARGQL